MYNTAAFVYLQKHTISDYMIKYQTQGPAKIIPNHTFSNIKCLSPLNGATKEELRAKTHSSHLGPSVSDNV